MTGKMLVIAACPFPANRGTPSRILRMSEAISNYYDVDILTYPIGENINYDSSLTIHRIDNFLNYQEYSAGPNLKKPILDLQLVLRGKDLLKNDQYEIIYAHHFEGSFVGCFWKHLDWFKGKLVFDVHSTLTGEIKEFDFFSSNYTNKFWEWGEKELIRIPDALVCVSEELKKLIQKENYVTSDSRIKIIPTGVRYNHLQSMPDTVSPFETSGPHIVYTGTLASYQNMELLPKIMSLVVKSTPKCEFYVITGNPNPEQVNQLRMAAQNYGIEDKLTIITDVPFKQIPTYLKHSDVLINLRTECPGIPQKLINYMTMGKPIVSFEGSAKPLVDKKNAIVVENNNIKEFSRGINNVLSNPTYADKISCNAKKDAKQYDWAKLAKELKEYLDKI